MLSLSSMVHFTDGSTEAKSHPAQCQSANRGGASQATIQSQLTRPLAHLGQYLLLCSAMALQSFLIARRRRSFSPPSTQDPSAREVKGLNLVPSACKTSARPASTSTFPGVSSHLNPRSKTKRPSNKAFKTWSRGCFYRFTGNCLGQRQIHVREEPLNLKCGWGERISAHRIELQSVMKTWKVGATGVVEK